MVDLIADVYSSLEIGDKSITRFSLGMPEDILLPIAKLNKELIRAMQALPGNGTGMMKHREICDYVNL